eukprot:PhF_6_TR15046/c0_g1_i1/m.23612
MTLVQTTVFIFVTSGRLDTSCRVTLNVPAELCSETKRLTISPNDIYSALQKSPSCTVPLPPTYDLYLWNGGNGTLRYMDAKDLTPYCTALLAPSTDEVRTALSPFVIVPQPETTDDGDDNNNSHTMDANEEEAAPPANQQPSTEVVVQPLNPAALRASVLQLADRLFTLIAEKDVAVPPYLMCSVCRRLCIDPVIVRCCGGTACRTCVKKFDDHPTAKKCGLCFEGRGGDLQKPFFENTQRLSKLETFLSKCLTTIKNRTTSSQHSTPMSTASGVGLPQVSLPTTPVMHSMGTPPPPSPTLQSLSSPSMTATMNPYNLQQRSLQPLRVPQHMLNRKGMPLPPGSPSKDDTPNAKGGRAVTPPPSPPGSPKLPPPVASSQTPTKRRDRSHTSHHRSRSRSRTKHRKERKKK